MAPQKRSVKRSEIWNFFQQKPKSEFIAVCNVCKQEVSFKSTSFNLKRHMSRKHPLVKLSDSRSQEKVSEIHSLRKLNTNEETEPISVNINTQFVDHSQPSASTSILPQSQERTACVRNAVIQSDLSTLLKRKMGVSARKKLDEILMLLFTHDIQPFSLVEDYGFRKFVETLNSSYELPSRKAITNTLLPVTFEEIYNNTKRKISEVRFVTLTTDCWTSQNSENYLTVTAHYIDSNFELKSLLLECSRFDESHTSVNLAEELRRIITEWNIGKKILLVVSDNAKNICKAIKEILMLKHFGCYGHTINLIANDALKHGSGITNKISAIVRFFKKSPATMAKFQDQQKNLGRQPKKLLQGVATRWNSTYFMVDRFVELEEPIRTTVALIDKDLPIISIEEWIFLKELTKILKPLESITNIMSGETYATGSYAIILTNGIVEVYSNFRKDESYSALSQTIINTISLEINTRLGNLEISNSLILTTFLDPRFKNLGFTCNNIAAKAKEVAISQITSRIKNNTRSRLATETTEHSGSTAVVQEENDIWGNFDRKVASFQTTGSAQSKALVEVQRYLEEQPINRTSDPLKWWRENSYNYPHLSELMQDKFISVVTSVPCERLFSKSGEIVSDRRSRLSATKVKQLLFVNCNSEVHEK